jgi:hypothetical protein
MLPFPTRARQRWSIAGSFFVTCFHPPEFGGLVHGPEGSTRRRGKLLVREFGDFVGHFEPSFWKAIPTVLLLVLQTQPSRNQERFPRVRADIAIAAAQTLDVHMCVFNRVFAVQADRSVALGDSGILYTSVCSLKGRVLLRNVRGIALPRSWRATSAAGLRACTDPWTQQTGFGTG